MPEELKPCPFCGGKAELILIKGMDEKYIKCTNCGVSTLLSIERKTVIREWNRRADNGSKTD